MAVVLLSVAAACGDDDGSGANPERFCEIIAQLDQQGILELEAFRENQNLLGEAVGVAPDEIRSSVEAVAGSYTPFFDLLEAADFDIAQIDEADLSALFDEEGADGERAVMDEWIAANCSNPESPETPTDPRECWRGPVELGSDDVVTICDPSDPQGSLIDGVPTAIWVIDSVADDCFELSVKAELWVSLGEIQRELSTEALRQYSAYVTYAEELASGLGCDWVPLQR